MEDPGIGTIEEPGVGARRRLEAVARSKRRRRAWAAAATLLAIAGIAGASVGAAVLARNDSNRSHEAFVASSAEIASTLELTILHEEDLVVSAQAFFAEHSHATNTEFVRWANAIRAFERYPELVGFGFSEIVPASQLASYAARVTADPPAPVPGGRFQVLPAGNRSYYCLSPVGRTRLAGSGPPVGFDFCAADPAGLALLGRDTGRGAYAPVDFGSSTSLSVSTPVYRGGVAPSTPAGRRAAFLGWVGMAVVPKLVLARALAGHPGMAATMRFREGRSDVVFSGGTRPKGARTVSQDLHNGWTVQTFREVETGGVFGNAGASAVLGAGIAMSFLLAALLFVLATGRARAWRLVDDKTDELRHQALHDSLTGLPNRALVVDRADQLLARNRRAGCDGAAMFLDLDEFKNVNDNLGHEAGDDLLKAVAERLASCLRESDTVGRIGGDEFVVLVDGGPLHVGPDLVAERLLDVLRQPFELAGAPTPVTVTASIGIAVGDRRSAGELLRDADVAMYLAKGAGKNRYEVFGPQMEIDVRQRYEMEFELRSALEAHQFRLVYQPIYNLDDLAVIGVEALLRWDHPTLGVVSPGEFIPLLEASGHIVEVGRAVLIEACRQMASWHAAGSELGVSVNVSARQLDHDVIVDQVREALALSGLDAAMLTIEVTETALMANADTTAQRLHQLKALGVQLAIDDFGTGYSSLAYLQKFPVDSLKIDRTFTDGISRSPESKALIHTLVQLGRDLGLRTLAEGVETSEQIDQLRGQHVNEAQGFLLARPLDPVTFETTILGHTPQPAGEHAM
jgi:diguanylate cyclase (GGDEF)-like protein